ncbi:hypothetical protein [Paenibacillus daejeonensis]|uniref:hypothetical protein n=1 Tax=Paenibacillus daejeonensis TaxID=135193 RepID=UPI000369C40A|nr:hypothetical protein [Paenibacillus daejeonensis]
MRLEEWQLLRVLDTLTTEEKEQLRQDGETHFGKAIDLSPQGLSGLSMELLIPLRDAARGLLITRKNAPGMHEAMQEANQPGTASSGSTEG